MCPAGPDPLNMPMPPDRFADLVRQRGELPVPDPLVPVPRREPATSTDSLAAELLAESADRQLESGELLLVSEEATLDDLEKAAAAIAPADPVESALPAEFPPFLIAPCLLSPRVWQALEWQPPLAEHSRLLEAALLTGSVVPQTMLVGHLETFPERVEHLLRLREMLDQARPAGGTIVLTVALADVAELPSAGGRMESIIEQARPSTPDHDRRHAVAMARLALGPNVVRV